MSAKRPLSSVFHADIQKDQQSGQPSNGRKRGKKKVVVLLFFCLALFFFLASLASTRFFNQKPVPLPAPLKPVGDVAIVTAPGFDTCVAPPAPLLKTWWSASPYRWLNVYLGGASMFPNCGGKNLTPEWVNTVYEQGWSLLPTWVGPQAPCAAQHTVMSNNPLSSYVQGQAEADAASNAASKLDFSSTAPIYFDLEHFNPTRQDGSLDRACIQAVNTFLNGWNDELTARNHLAGVYASASNYPVLGSSIMAASVVAWIAGGGSWTETYNHLCTVYGNTYVPDSDWSAHQRIYQYTGGHDETYGQKTWNIDSDCADAPMVGHATTMPVVLQFQHS
jgi:hypothetical protein